MMFKKINQYLITHYPLIWNLKLVGIGLVGLLINAMAYINGYLHFSHPSGITGYGFKNIFFSELYVFYYFIIILMTLIIWLYFYIKNNRFKSKYPTSINYLFKEFLGVFGILIIFASVPNMFQMGLHTRNANFMTDEEFAADVDLINRVIPFTLQKQNGYSNYSRNLTVPIFDSLVSPQEVLALYTKHKKEYVEQNKNYRYKDLVEPYFRNEEFNELLYQKLSPQYTFKNLKFQNIYHNYGEKLDHNYNETYYASEDVMEMDSIIVDETNIKSIPPIPTIHSLYNYSFQRFQVPHQPEKNHQYYDEQLIRLLQSNDVKQMEQLLTVFQQKLEAYKIGYRFKNKSWIDYVYQPPYYFINNHLTADSYYSGVNNSNKDYINVSSLVDIYENIQYSKFHYSFFDDLIYYITGALTLALIIMMFRLTSFKVWLISGIGLGILSIIGSSIGLTLSFLGITKYTEYIIPLTFYSLFVLFSLYGLSTNRRKIITGVHLNWWLISSVIVIFIVLGFYRDIKEEMIYKTEVLKNPNFNHYDIYGHPDLEFIDQMFNWCLYFNPILVIIIFYGIITTYRKWQAMADE